MSPSAFSGSFKNKIYHIDVPTDVCGGVLTALFVRHLTRKNSHQIYSAKPFAQSIEIHPLGPDQRSPITPSFVRSHYKSLSLDIELLHEYEHFLDLAEIISQAQRNHSTLDLSSEAGKLYALFCSSHPAIQPTELYKNLVQQIYSDASVEALFDSDPLYSALFLYAEKNDINYKQPKSKNHPKAELESWTANQIHSLFYFLNPERHFTAI